MGTSSAGPSLSECCDEVHPGLWVGAMPTPEWDLDAWGVSLVVSLSDHLPPQAARRFEWGTRGGAQGDGRVLFTHWPFEDGPLPPWGQTELVASLVVAALARGCVVLVHCQEGRNRSGLIAALAVWLDRGCTGSEALSQVRSRRPGMVYNQRFAALLESLPAPARGAPLSS